MGVTDMASNVRLRLGNLLIDPSDLIILLCSTSGTDHWFRRPQIGGLQNSPSSREGMKLGSVEFMPFDGAENIAQFVGFAASVSGNSSKIEAIREIGRSIGEFTQDHKGVTAIAVPLLGRGLVASSQN